MDPWLIVFGFGVGILVGTTGTGGGSLTTPLLILVSGIKPVAVPLALGLRAYLVLRSNPVKTPLVPRTDP